MSFHFGDHPFVRLGRLGPNAQVHARDTSLQIETDYFRSTPVFVGRTVDGRLHITSHISDLLDDTYVSKSVDQVGAWEQLMLGNPLASRTLHTSISQVPANATLEVDLQTGEYSISLRQLKHVVEDDSIRFIDTASRRAMDALDTEFEKLDRSAQYLLGLSGGLDSRLTLAMLVRHVPKRNIRLYTYGHSPQILEYRYAVAAADFFGLDAPVFHQLTPTSYRRALEFLPRMSGGLIGIGHVHALDFLRTVVPEGLTHLSTMASDAILGWSVASPSNLSKKSFLNSVMEPLASSAAIPSVVDEAACDLLSIIGGEAPKPFSSYAEFMYVRERNPKFHTLLAFLQHEVLPGVTPFASEGLMNSFLRIPARFRARKRLADAVLTDYFHGLSDPKRGHISSRFQWGRSNAPVGQWVYYRGLSATESLLRQMTRGRVALFNPFSTEAQGAVLSRDFRRDLNMSEQSMVALGLISEFGQLGWSKPPLKTRDIAPRFDLLTMSSLLQQGYLSPIAEGDSFGTVQQ